MSAVHSQVHSKVEEKVRALPDRPGIYVFEDEAGKPLYVGKAKSLRKRGVTYLAGGHDPRISTLR